MNAPEDRGGRPSTGDPGVDRILRELDERLEADAPGQVEAVSEAHRLLQARLSPQQPPPGQARPGPR